MSSEEKFQADIDSLRQDVEGLKTKLYLKETAMELLLANLAKTEQKLAVMQQQMDDVLLGSIATFAMPEQPDGWLACDGQEVSRQTYARLFAKIGTTFGEGDGESTFNLPDLRSVFVRGWDEEREFASLQEDQMQGHTHRDGGHCHQGSTNSTGSHKHDGKLDTDGNHRHEGNAKNDGNHNHILEKNGDDYFRATGFCIEYPKDKQEPRQNVLSSFKSGAISGYSWSDVYSSYILATDSAGLHTHSLSTDSAGSHYHDLEINSAGSHTHSFSTASASANLGLPSVLSHGEPRFGSETRPRNVALLFCIKY